ncbi:MAG: hypothetical protein V1857_00580 [archaeon]
MVRTELCTFCVKSGILCAKCEERVRKGQITKLDLETIKLLLELEKRHPDLESLRFYKASDLGDIVAIQVDQQDIEKISGKREDILRDISDRIGGKKIILVGRGGDDRRFLEELLSPLAILTINTVWLPDGSTETKVILQGRMPRYMPANLETVSRVARELRNLTLRIEFERR